MGSLARLDKDLTKIERYWYMLIDFKQLHEYQNGNYFTSVKAVSAYKDITGYLRGEKITDSVCVLVTEKQSLIEAGFQEVEFVDQDMVKGDFVKNDNDFPEYRSYAEVIKIPSLGYVIL